MRYRFETDKLSPGRPVLQIGHHMIAFNYLEGSGHRIKLPDGPTFAEPKSEMKLGEWIDLVIEYRKGEITIGVHMIAFNYLEGSGHRIKLPDGPTFAEPKSEMKLGEWIDLVIEYRKGEITIGVNGYSKTYKHKAVTIINEKDKLGPRFTFKGGPNCRIVFDSVRLWKCEE